MTDEKNVPVVENSRNLAERFITTDRIIAVFGIPISAGMGYVLSLASDRDILVGMLFIFSATVILLMVALYFTARRTTQLDSAIGRFREEAIFNQKTFSDNNDRLNYAKDIIEYNSTRFSTLHERERTFHDSVMKTIECLVSSGKILTSEDWETVLKRYDSVMTYICDTATTVISKSKSVSEDITTSNIKLIQKNSLGEVVYAPYFRSTTSSAVRRAHDSDLHAKPPVVTSNRPYDRISSGVEARIICNDVDEYVKNTKIANESMVNVKYLEPNNKTKSFYNSFIVVPIKATAGAVITSGDKDAIISSSSGDIVGFFCIDSLKKSFFDEYDIRIMSQLADQALGVVRAFYLAKSIRDGISLRNN